MGVKARACLSRKRAALHFDSSTHPPFPVLSLRELACPVRGTAVSVMLGLKPVLSRLRAEGGRRYMSAVKTPDNNAFSGTIQLPKTRFPLRSDPAQDQTVVKKTTEDLYKWQVGARYFECDLC